MTAYGGDAQFQPFRVRFGIRSAFVAFDRLRASNGVPVSLIFGMGDLRTGCCPRTQQKLGRIRTRRVHPHALGRKSPQSIASQSEA